MDDIAWDEHLTLLSWTWESSNGLGTLLREYRTPEHLLSALDQLGDSAASVAPATLRALHQARRAWPRRHPRRTAHAQLIGSATAFVPIGSLAYPKALVDIPDPPAWLFCRGDLDCLAAPAVAIVGSRHASHAGLRAADEIAGTLAANGYVVASGLALGIDASAHRGALRQGRTLAVLASGLDRLSPPRHRALGEQIAAKGCLLTELPPGTQPAKHQFPRRNRIISGLARATIIIEAALPSGTLHTAAAALEQGREVYTLPWSIYHPGGSGCLRLLRDGAQPITSLEDLMTLFPGLQMRRGSSAGSDTLSNATQHSMRGRAGKIIAALGDGSLPLEVLCQTTGIAAGPMLVELAELEMSGWVQLRDGAYRVTCGPR